MVVFLVQVVYTLIKMERLFDQASLIKTLQDGLKKPNPKNPDRMVWTLEVVRYPTTRMDRMC